MKNLLYVLLAMLILTSAACSKSSDDETMVSDNCYISAFSLGQMKRLISSKTSQGADTTYYVSYSGAAFPMVINQREQTVTLAEPLLMDTRIDAVLATVTFTGALVHAPENDTTTWTTYSSTDSVDFTTPRIYRVVSTDGRSHRDYRVSLKMRSDLADGYTWQRKTESMPQLQIPAIDWKLNDEMTDNYQVQSELVYFQRNGEQRLMLACRKNGAEATEPLTIWSRIIDDDDEWMRIDLSEDNPYGLVAPHGLTLVSYDHYLLAFVFGSSYIYVSRDNGITWKKDSQLTIPSDISLFADDGTPFPISALASGEYVWFAIGDQVWTLRSNSYGEK